MSITQMVQRMMGKRIAAATTPSLPRQDVGLPFGTQIGGLLEIPRASFALLDGTLLSMPASAQMQIESVGRVRMDADPRLELYRLYTSKGSSLNDKGQSFLQVIMQDGAPVESTYYQQLFRLTPTTAEDQEAYLGHGYGLGDQFYQLGADQLALAGLRPGKIEDLLQGAESLEFVRDTPVDDEYVRPYLATENRLDDPAGMKGMRQRIHFMPYRREVSGGVEQLMISFEVVESVDGVSAPAVHVDFQIGLTLEPQKIKVI